VRDTGKGGLGGGGGGGTGGSVGSSAADATPAQANTGGGGGGGRWADSPYTGKGGNGGSGIVIIRYPANFDPPASLTGTDGVQSGIANGYRVYVWTNSGTITF
jgi:hypothetical protein